ncbi:DUF1703-domain-containing protein [Rozella allomycis CSF55]|uniref:DUF1703-domain-containing protein n=1 Tax=Rozella allomycis (strain CSF55) TaxID=988480 RepID=A0A4P9YFQ4_ROZAC|nr:DUF1703-domain-containing protein [Rozella allomycis CSF55]
MLKSFFRLGTDPSLFEGLYIFERELSIEKKKTFMEEYCGQYPVLHLDLKDVVGNTWEETLKKLWKAVRKMAEEHRDVYERMRPGQNPYGFDIDDCPPPSEDFVQDSLSKLMELLHEYHKTQVIVLIDEYDTPLNNAQRKGFYDQAIKFFYTFFSMALKDNDSLYKACIMGVAEIRGEGLMYCLNNVIINSFLDKDYSSCFGFTLAEIRQLGVNEGELNDVIHWYNGYYFGNSQVLNPWSVISWLQEGKKFGNYWIDTARTTSLQEYLRGHEQSTLLEIFTLLYDEDGLDIKLTNTQVHLNKSNQNVKGIINFLVLTGYLTYHNEEILVPNKEVKDHWKEHILPMLDDISKNLYGNRVAQVFGQDTFDSGSLAVLMRDILLHSSSQDLGRRKCPEALYHCLFFGIFLASIHNGEDVIVQSNKEAGNGRYDVRITFPYKKIAFIIEFKVCKDLSTIDRASDVALSQIGERDYCHDLTGYQCHLMGIAFFKKFPSIKYAFLQK